MGAALLLVRHLIWCAYQNKVLCRCAAGTSRYGRPWVLRRLALGGGSGKGGWVAKAHGRTGLVRRVWGRGGLLGAAPGQRLQA